MNRTLPSLHGVPFENMLTVPLIPEILNPSVSILSSSSDDPGLLVYNWNILLKDYTHLL